MEWETIQELIKADDTSKWDLRVDARQLHFDVDGTLKARKNGNAEAYRLSDFALAQLCQKLSIPARYFKRLPKEMQAALANYDLSRLADTGFFLRGKVETIRAVLSDRYSPYNNRDVIEAAEATVKEHGLAVRSFALEERGMFLKLITSTQSGRALELKAGAMIGNSEVGFAQVTVEPFLYRQPCTNDLILAENVAFRHRHMSLSGEKFNERIAQGIVYAVKLAETAVFTAHVADQQPVPNPTREIEQLGKEWNLDVRVRAAVLAAFEEEPRATRFGVANSFTRAAQRLGPIERIEIERLAGRLLAA
jgi:hypothetical protein